MNPEDIEEIIVNLELEDGRDLECEIICIFEYGGSDFAALTPTDESIEELYFFGLKMGKRKGDEVDMELLNIEDDELLSELAEAFEQIMSEEDDEDEVEDTEEDSKWDEFINKKIDD